MSFPDRRMDGEQNSGGKNTFHEGVIGHIFVAECTSHLQPVLKKFMGPH